MMPLLLILLQKANGSFCCHHVLELYSHNFHPKTLCEMRSGKRQGSSNAPHHLLPFANRPRCNKQISQVNSICKFHSNFQTAKLIREVSKEISQISKDDKLISIAFPIIWIVFIAVETSAWAIHTDQHGAFYSILHSIFHSIFCKAFSQNFSQHFSQHYNKN